MAALAFSTNEVAVSDAEVQRQLEGIARELSLRLPLGNASALIVSVTAGPGRRLTYGVASHLLAKEWTEEQKAHHREVKRNLYCFDRDMKFFRERGVTVVFSVADEDGIWIDDAATGPSDCR
ncbi:hypothetical protein VAR608DRAFT_1043 [Variovorax sp. HW608]|nr:hypothetical protein VAR608DRAFT_1043 [Variovorax sp. HW608]